MELRSRLRQPKHVGENRCAPCTVVNVGIAVVACGVLGLWDGGVSAVAFAACLAVIYLRGYLVPGTPTLTKRYLPDRVLRRFGKAPAQSSPPATFSPEELLVNAGVIGPCEHADDLCLRPGFRTAWRDRIEAVRERDPGATRLERAIDGPDELTFETVGGNVVAIHDNATVGQWSSTAAIIADVAATDVLPSAVSAWERLSPVERLRLLGSLRLFLETCPACDGSVELGEDIVDSCCRSYDVVRAACRGCDARVFEIEWT